MSAFIVYPTSHFPKSVVALTTQRGSATHSDQLSSSRAESFVKSDYDFLNMGLHVGDSDNRVSHNRKYLQQSLKLDGFSPTLIWINQVHGTDILEIESLEHAKRVAASTNCVDADAIYTKVDNVACCIMTADCLPILIASDDGSEVAAVHAGWRGLARGIIESTVYKFVTPPDRLTVWIGPAISQKYFETGHELVGIFQDYMSAISPSTSSPGKVLVDIIKIAYLKCQRLGIGHVELSNECTYSCHEQYFSYRRSSHLGHENCGRMVSLVFKK